MEDSIIEVAGYRAWYGLVGFYGLLIYFALHQASWGLDFASYYAYSHEVGLGLNPYHSFLSDPRVPLDAYFPGNPNPPITLLLFSGFSYFSYPVAFLLWSAVSLGLGLYGVYISLGCLSPTGELKPKHASIFLLYIIAFPVIMNAGMGQLGNILLFLVAMGYAAYLKQNDRWAGFWWGLLIAIKLFPGLLFVYVLLKRRFQLFAWMLAWSLCLSVAPILLIGLHAYVEYIDRILNGVNWYGINWNASLLGFLYRILVEVRVVPFTGGMHTESLAYMPVSPTQSVKQLYYFITSLTLLIWIVFFKRIDAGSSHRGFAFTLILMLLLSPMGWLYYFPMLFIPLICTFYASSQRTALMIGWFFTLFLLYFPMSCVHAVNMETWLQKITLYSIHFYGLLALAYLTLTMQHDPHFYKQSILPAYVSSIFKLITYFSLSFIVIRMLLLGMKMVVS